MNALTPRRFTDTDVAEQAQRDHRSQQPSLQVQTIRDYDRGRISYEGLLIQRERLEDNLLTLDQIEAGEKPHWKTLDYWLGQDRDMGRIPAHRDSIKVSLRTVNRQLLILHAYINCKPFEEIVRAVRSDNCPVTEAVMEAG
ncbi:MAG: hypothetical protein AAF583_11165 [Pseudomonadota bacterium]